MRYNHEKAPFSTQPCVGLEALTNGIVAREIDFSRTVMFTAEIDATEIEQLRIEQRESLGRPSYTAFVAQAVAKSLAESPHANRRLYRPFGLPYFWRYQRFNFPDIAIAIERDVESFSAVAYLEILRNAHTDTRAAITEKLKSFSQSDLNSSQQWRSFYWVGMRLPGILSSLLVSLPLYLPKLWCKYRGAAAMISTPAKYGVDGVVGAWSHPLGFSFGLVQPKPVVRDGQVVVAPAFTFAMNFDRRVMAGAEAARFFAAVTNRLRHPPK